jgi:chromosome segregation ATPase
MIAQLRLQVEELKEDLREERDHIFVDIDTHCVEELESKVEEITKELDSEKESKLQLSTKLGDLESSFQEAQSDKDKILNLESKLNAAEARLREFEAAQESPDFNDTTTKM